MKCKILLSGIILFILLCTIPVLAEDGKFVVSSDPYGAEVTFDGTFVGTTSVTIPVGPDSPPPHTISIRYEGYQSWENTYQENPVPGYPILVSTTLVPIKNSVILPVTPTPPLTPPVTQPTEIPITIPQTPIGGDYGWFDISSSPSGGDVIFNGKYVGDTPVSVKVMTTGTPRNSIEVDKQGYKNWYQEYPTNPGPGETIQVFAQLQPIQTSGSISVQTDPKGAYATVDQGYQLTTPCTFTDINPGLHKISISKPGYQPYSTRVQVQTGVETPVTVVLSPTEQAGTLRASSSPSGADLYFDNSYRGNTPLQISGLSAGPHTVSMKRSGYQDWGETVYITAGQSTSISPVLSPYPPSPITGDIQVTSIPAGANVFLDSEYQGTTTPGQSLDITDVTPGIHAILLEHSSFQDYSANIQITAGATTVVSAALVPPPEVVIKTGTLIASSDPSGADIYLNNQYMGITPASLSNIQAGSYTILLRVSGYEDYANTVEIKAGDTTQASAVLTPLVTPTSTPTATPTPVPGFSIPVVPIVIIVVILGLISIIAYLLMKKR